MFWIQWTRCTVENGLGGVYHCNTNYLPLYHYILYGFGQLLGGNIERIIANVYQLKAVTLVFHFCTGYMLLSMLVRYGINESKALLLSLFFLLNVSILYNSIVWGQVDGIVTCFVFAAFYAAWTKRIIFALVALLLALNFKLQAIIFVPLITLMLLPAIFKQFSVKRLLTWLSTLVIVQGLILLPFILAGTHKQIWIVVSESVGKNPVISMNAFNLWDLLVPGDLMHTPDSLHVFGLSYKSWGLLTFFSLSLLALLPLLKRTWEALISPNKQHAPLPLQTLLLIGALIPLIFFYFNTQMHERYSHPAMVFLVGHALISRRPIWAVIGCLAYILNLEAVLKFFHSDGHTGLIFNRDLISVLYLITIAGLFFELYANRSAKKARLSSHEVFTKVV